MPRPASIIATPGATALSRKRVSRSGGSKAVAIGPCPGPVSASGRATRSFLPGRSTSSMADARASWMRIAESTTFSRRLCSVTVSICHISPGFVPQRATFARTGQRLVLTLSALPALGITTKNEVAPRLRRDLSRQSHQPLRAALADPPLAPGCGHEKVGHEHPQRSAHPCPTASPPIPPVCFSWRFLQGGVQSQPKPRGTNSLRFLSG
jgi:hypothetical protein